MTRLFEVLQQADARRSAVGHFNVSDLVTLYGVVEAARQQGLPVVIGVSEAEESAVLPVGETGGGHGAIQVGGDYSYDEFQRRAQAL